jgi:hypothetical protein
MLRAGLFECRPDLPGAVLRRASVDLASAVDSHLPPARRQELWKRLAGSTCAGAAEIRPWLTLHRAIAAEEAKDISAAAGRLLQGEVAGEVAPYAVAAHMTGLLLADDRDGALRVFQEHRGKLGANPEAWDPVLRLLFGLASAK